MGSLRTAGSRLTRRLARARGKLAERFARRDYGVAVEVSGSFSRRLSCYESRRPELLADVQIHEPVTRACGKLDRVLLCRYFGDGIAHRLDLSVARYSSYVTPSRFHGVQGPPSSSGQSQPNAMKSSHAMLAAYTRNAREPSGRETKL